MRGLHGKVRVLEERTQPKEEDASDTSHVVESMMGLSDNSMLMIGNGQAVPYPPHAGGMDMGMGGMPGMTGGLPGMGMGVGAQMGMMPPNSGMGGMGGLGGGF
jgi:hypothetical protein